MTSLHRRTTWKWIARLHFWVMFFSFFLYLGLGFTLGHEFLFRDIRGKFLALADDTITVTAVVLGPPLAPVVTATPTCVLGAARIVLDWADDSGTTTWDIDRDSLPLTTGLFVSQYSDTAVSANTSYSYQVAAYGPMSPGSAVSALVSATTLDCVNIVPVTITIETLGGKSLADDRANFDLSKRRPKVTGTTNTPYAIIDIFMTNPSIRARITANANGYFEWIPPIKLDTGNHILTVTATDPADSSRTGTDSFTFWIKNVSQDREKTEDALILEEWRPGKFDFAVIVKNVDQTLYQEETLIAEIVTKGAAFPTGTTGQAFLNDPSRQDVFRLSGEMMLGGQTSTTLETRLPLYLEPGEYRVRADVVIDDETISREAELVLKGLPLLFLGGREITYVEAASYVGSFFFALLFLFLFFLLLFIREYWLYLHSLRVITERHLARFGFLGLRKEVIR